MSRIRSVHPGLWTDETFVSVSVQARLLVIGLWGECDDQGVFEWKPLTIKMRLAPADDVDVQTLLAELVGAGILAKYTEGGRDYGAVRNFGKFQKPKKPQNKHPLPDRWRTFVGYGVTSGEPVPRQSGTGEENHPLMEEGDKKESPLPPKPTSQLNGLDGVEPYRGKETEHHGRPTVAGWFLDNASDRVMDAAGIDQARWRGDLRPLIGWLRDGYEPDVIVTEIKRSAARPDYRPPFSLAWFDKAVRSSRRKAS